MQLVSKSQIVGNDQVDDDLIQNLVFVAALVERRHQASLDQAVDHVVFSLGDPDARGLQRTHILRVLAAVDGVVHLDADVLAIPRGQLEAIAPEVRLSLQTHRFVALHARRLLHVDGDRQPYSGLHVHPPTVEVEVVLGGILGSGRGVSAVEADDVAILILNPDAAIEAAHAFDFGPGMHVEDPGADRTHKLRAHKAEDIVLCVESRRVKEHHLHEAVRLIGKLLQPQRLAETADGRQRTGEEIMLAGGFGAGRPVHKGFVGEDLAEVYAAQHVRVRDRHLIELHVRPGVLDVGLHQRGTQLNAPDQDLFARDRFLHQGGLFGGELAHLSVLWFLFRECACRTQGNDKENEGDLPKHHVKLLA